ncbi:MAG: Arc family DNA-binding protein [Comamonas sp.]|jgi:hypothetical protein|uniref:Arc family DNA-binding protein n=1 Tax=Comamonas sp. TaxID=34028 RepID=UPI0028219560|nr:Arc family DNA-binding protein [Comamonas sp.]MDR0216199.1 Arc family DNA-binding protein [Comamonas sp.]
MSEKRKPQSADKYIVRFPDGMRDKIAEAAKANNRTMNAEIVARLEQKLNNGLDVLMLDARVAQLETQLRIVQVGLNISRLAAQLLLLESPAVEGLKSYVALTNSIAAAMEGAPEKEAEMLEERLASAKSAIDKLLTTHKEIMKFSFPAEVGLDKMADLTSDAVDAIDPLLKKHKRPSKNPTDH